MKKLFLTLLIGFVFFSCNSQTKNDTTSEVDSYTTDKTSDVKRMTAEQKERFEKILFKELKTKEKINRAIIREDAHFVDNANFVEFYFDYKLPSQKYLGFISLEIKSKEIRKHYQKVE